MSLRGVRQLKELLIRYSDYDGSSKGIRQWMQENLVTFAKANPLLSIVTEIKRGPNNHPFVRGNYQNTNSKTICVKNLDQEDITDHVYLLRNQIGRRMNSDGYKKPVVSRHPSIQGEWHERMDLIDLELKITSK
jgi:large subunit ribosomal protein L43